MKPYPEQIQNVNKPIMETLLNYSAIGLTIFGITQLTLTGTSNLGFVKAFFLMISGIGLEYFKYWGRQKNLW